MNLYNNSIYFASGQKFLTAYFKDQIQLKKFQPKRNVFFISQFLQNASIVRVCH